MGKPKDITNQRVGSLTAIEISEEETILENNRQHSKSFKTKEEAISYRKYLEEKYQKEYSYENSMGGNN